MREGALRKLRRRGMTEEVIAPSTCVYRLILQNYDSRHFQHHCNAKSIEFIGVQNSNLKNSGTTAIS